MLDADIMSGILSNERTRWRGKFAVVEDRLQKRKAAIGTAHEAAVAMVTDSLRLVITLLRVFKVLMVFDWQMAV